MRKLLKIKQEKYEKRDNGYKVNTDYCVRKRKDEEKKIENKNSFYLK